MFSLAVSFKLCVSGSLYVCMYVCISLYLSGYVSRGAGERSRAPCLLQRSGAFAFHVFFFYILYAKRQSNYAEVQYLFVGSTFCHIQT